MGLSFVILVVIYLKTVSVLARIDKIARDWEWWKKKWKALMR